MAIVDLDFNKWIGEFRAYNPDLFNGKQGLSERTATDIAQIAFQAGKNAARKTTASQADTTPAAHGVERDVPRTITGYGECHCILTQYCDGYCNPIFADSIQAASAPGADHG